MEIVIATDQWNERITETRNERREKKTSMVKKAFDVIIIAHNHN